MRACLRFAPMIGSREGELPAEEARALAAHLSECASCRALAAEAAVLEGLVSEALLAKAAARDFSPFVDLVLSRVERAPVRRSLWPRAAGLPNSAPARGRGLAPPFLALLARNWKLATAFAVALVAAASVFMYVHRDHGESEEIASLEIDLEGGDTVLQTSDGPVVLFAPDESGS